MTEKMKDFTEIFLGEVHDLKALRLIVGIYTPSEGKNYVTRDTLYERLKIDPSKTRAYDSRLKSLLEAGWLELDGQIKGRYKLSPMGRMYIIEHVEISNKITSIVTYEGTKQYVIKMEVNPSETVDFKNIRDYCMFQLVKRGYQLIRSSDNKIFLVYRDLWDHALIEVILRDNQVEVRTTSNFVHLLKRLGWTLDYFKVGEVKKLDLNEEKIIISLSIMVLNQILQTIMEGVMIESGSWKHPTKLVKMKVKEAKKEDKPKYHLLETS
jgi:hypothetical protein